MIEYILANIWVFIIPIEIALLFVFYKYYFAEYNAKRWKAKAEEEGFMAELLSPVIELVTDNVSSNVLNALKYEFLSGQGTLSRQVMAGMDDTNPQEALMGISESLLKSMNYKNPNPLITMKLAQGLGTIIGNLTQENQESNGAQPAALDAGIDLINRL
jgi:hypothetical protein